MSGKAQHCPVCRTTADLAREGGRDAFEVECRVCGKYVITGTLLSILENLEEGERGILPYLSAHTRQTCVQGLVSTLDTSNWGGYAQAHMTTPVSRKVGRLLELVAGRSRYPGQTVKLDPKADYPLLDAQSPEEVSYLRNYLQEAGFLREYGDSYEVTVKGWEHLEPPSGGAGLPGRCFVGMSFDKSMLDAYELGIRAALEDDCRLKAVRVDREEHNEKICDKILAEIRLAQFVVADFTDHRAGVYFEAGFALGLGRPVIWTCREDQLDRSHFDTRQYNHIAWSSPLDLRKKLTDRIRATVL